MLEGQWKLLQLTGQEESNQASGCKLKLEEEAQKRLLWGSIESARHGEQFGHLTLKAGSKTVFDGDCKLTRQDTDPRRKKQGKSKASRSRYQVVPATRLDGNEFKVLYQHVGINLSAQFVVKAESGEPAGDGRPPADDDNVQPESTAAAMKANARKKLAAAAA